MRLSSLPFLDGLIDAAICCVQQETNCMRRHPHTFPRDGQQRVDSPPHTLPCEDNSSTPTKQTLCALTCRPHTLPCQSNSSTPTKKTSFCQLAILWSGKNNALTERRKRFNYRWQTTLPCCLAHQWKNWRLWNLPTSTSISGLKLLQD